MNVKKMNTTFVATRHRPPFSFFRLISLFILILGGSSAFTTANASVGCSSQKSCAHASNSSNESASSFDAPKGNGERRLKDIKAREAELFTLLAEVRQEKAEALASQPLNIGVVGFGRFGQFIAKAFAKHGHNVVATSRSDYTKEAAAVGASYISLSDPEKFFDNNGNGIDVLVVAVSILSFEQTLLKLIPFMKDRDMLVVDVLSVKEHPREMMLNLLPASCDILCTHPMFGPDSGKNSWRGLNFVYERVRVKGIVNPEAQTRNRPDGLDYSDSSTSAISPSSLFFDAEYASGIDRLERFLSIWEEEGCRMVELSCNDHDKYAANSQFITHLVGRILGAQGLVETPIDTKGFESVRTLIGTTTADSFDLFYGLYKHNQNSLQTILTLRKSMDDVVGELHIRERKER
mmetsp:Transcript_39940/g.93755  ORF Transcript_39940/g.93755 Transcript_39940/m.93755 type:complete len:406 (-) Transcript_39940:702-1919(-)